METTTQPLSNASVGTTHESAKPPLYFADLFNFLRCYRDMEKAKIEEGFQQIVLACKDNPHVTSHLCDHWRWKKKDFGSFFLNLDPGNQKLFCKAFNVDHPLGQPLLNRLILFFNNHYIDANAVPGLTGLPREKKRFGSAANWADYLLSRPVTERTRITKWILDNYKG